MKKIIKITSKRTFTFTIYIKKILNATVKSIKKSSKNYKNRKYIYWNKNWSKWESIITRHPKSFKSDINSNCYFEIIFIPLNHIFYYL